MDVLVARVELLIPNADSLKAKRAVIQSLVRRIDGWNGICAAEVGQQELWQRAELGMAVVADGPARCSEVMDLAERRVWTTADIEVISFETSWWEAP